MRGAVENAPVSPYNCGGLEQERLSGTSLGDSKRRMTTRRKITVAVIIVAVVGLAIWGLVPSQPVPLTVTIVLDADTFREGDPIVLHARIVNEGDEPVKILEPSLADMTFEVAAFDAAGARLHYLRPYGLKKMDKDAGRYLEPGETVTLDVRLDSSFDLPPGRYSVQAAYRTLNYPDVDVPFCRIASNKLAFETLASE